MTQHPTPPRHHLTPLYCLHQAAYFFAIAGISAFAVTYLMSKGFASSQIGMMLALTNILSCALQPIIGSYVDRRSMSLLTSIILGFLLIAFVSLASIELLNPALAVTGLLFVIGSLTFSITVPLSNSLCAYYAQNGCRIDYGMGSGIGSLSFSFASLIIGYIIANLGTGYMMAFCLSFMVVQMILMLRYPRISPKENSRHRVNPSSGLSLPSFCLRYRYFILTLTGVLCLAACHAMAENYLIQIFDRMGGNSKNVGIALFLACTTAAPFLLLFERIQQRIQITALIRLSGLFFVLKAVLLIFASSVASVYLIELLQTCTYGFLYPSLYYFVSKRIPAADTAKGQTVASALYTLGTALGNSLGGVVIDQLGLNAMLALASSIAAAGTLLINTTISTSDAQV